MSVQPRSGCEGKRRHPSQEMADAFLVYAQSRRNEPKRRAKRLQTYHCTRCGYWHIGHRRLS